MGKTLESIGVAIDDITLDVKSKITVVFKNGLTVDATTSFTPEEFMALWNKSRRKIKFITSHHAYTIIRKSRVDCICISPVKK